MTALEDFATSLKGITATQRRPQPVLTAAERTAIVDAVKPFFEMYESQLEDLRAGTEEGPAWYGYDNEGVEYTDEQKQGILDQWKKMYDIPVDATLLRATIGEPKKAGPRARGPVTFYSYPSPKGLRALWSAKSEDLALLQGMVSSTDEEEDTK